MTALEGLSEIMYREAKVKKFELRPWEDRELISLGCGVTGGLEAECELQGEESAAGEETLAGHRTWP